MSETKEQVKHTPGPWKTDFTCPPEAVVAVNTPDDGGDIICNAPDDAEDSMRRWKANARLIAAAPELLEACRKALTCGLASYVRELVFNAIAKAEGRQ